jgi:VWFA-related protein
MTTLRRAWIFFFCLPLPLIAQQSPPSGGALSPPAPLRATSRETTLDVVASNKAEQPVAGLEQQDFELLDNKRPQKILSFQAVQHAAPDNPVKAILLVDTVNASFSQLSSERIQLEKFLMQNGGHLPMPVSIVFFSDKGINTQPEASTDGKTEVAFLDQNETSLSVISRAQGISGDYDRIARSLRALRAVAVENLSAPGRKLFIWVSPGWPIPPQPAIDLGPKEKEQIFNTIVTISGLLQVGRITVYSVDPLGTSEAGGLHTDRYKDFMNEIKNAGQAEVGNLALGVIATQSGGRVLYGSNDIGGEIASCLQDADAFYILTFAMPPADDTNEYHHLQIKIDKPGLKARTRSMYYAQP